MVTTRPGVVGSGERAASAPVSSRDDAAPPRTRLHTLDGLRFFAALGVMLYHYTAMWSTAWGEGRTPSEVWPDLGAAMIYFTLAPELFFVVSGFVILWTAWGRSAPAVVASRVSRLYPPYWAALALTSVLLLVVWPQGKQVTWGEAAVNVTLLQEAFGVRNVDGVYWTLWTELRFYLLITILVLVGLTTRRVLAFAALWPVTAVAVGALGWEPLGTLLIDRYAPYFAGGMLLFLIYRDGHSWRRWALVGMNVGLALLTTVAPTVATVEQVTEFSVSPAAIALTVVAVFAGVAVLTMTPVARWDVPVMAQLGALTYALYLVHQFWGLWVISLLHDDLPRWATLAAAVATALLLALLVHHVVEKRFSPPMRRRLERDLTRLAERLPGRAPNMSRLGEPTLRTWGQASLGDPSPERG